MVSGIMENSKTPYAFFQVGESNSKIKGSETVCVEVLLQLDETDMAMNINEESAKGRTQGN